MSVRFLGDLMRRQVEAIGISTPGACHRFRHAMATHMLENGADIRYIQVMLGHANLETTQIYTRVSMTKLKEVHAATHPARLTRKATAAADDAARATLQSLAADGDEADAVSAV